MATAPQLDRPDDLPSVAAEEEAALRDARAIVARAEADEAAAREARERYVRDGIPAIEPDDAVAAHLHGGERVYARRTSALVEGQGAKDDAVDAVAEGALYLTSTRLIHLGQRVVELPLHAIDELSIAGERLLVTMRDGSGRALQVSEPRLLRAQVAAARAELRGA